MSPHEAWISLRHGGNLLSPVELERLPEPNAAPYRLAERLRAALIALDPDEPDGEALSALLDVVLEDACGLGIGWRKGAAVKDPDAETLLDGTRLKPQRVWETAAGDSLPLFVTHTPRIGVGKGKQAVAHVVEYLRRRRRRGAPLALLTNGREWRLVWADEDNLAWVEWDADRWLDADQLSGTFHVFRRIVARPALDRDGAERGRLLEAIRTTRRGQAKLSSALGERVRKAVEILLKGRQSALAPTWDPDASSDTYNAACHFVMRLVVILFAEARELFPIDNPVYHQAYGLGGLFDRLGRLTGERRRERVSAWSQVLALFKLLHGGSPHPALNLPKYGGDLFKPGDPEGDGVQRALTRIESLEHPPSDEIVYRILELITRTMQQGLPTPVNFTELTSEYIGILYEGLLDYELHRAGDQPILFLNLGNQPALPLDQLEGMTDKALAALVEKAKVTNKPAGEDDAEEAEDEEAEGEDAEGEDDAEAAEAAEVSDSPAEAPLDDDEHAEARRRAVEWSRRAVVVGKLVKKPAGRNADKNPEYLAELDSAADRLFADIKLPGELYLVRWGGTRKGAGTFYTRPQLTQPTVRRTLEPLTHDADGVIHLPEVLLDLKLCDPAMGSGSFLVAALRVLTELVVESLRFHKRIHVVNGHTMVDCDRLPDADRDLATDNFDERLTAFVRRAVVERCLYGVDIDPLATELARVALWVETLDRKLPFTFLDHKLRCGDALVGAWIDRFRDYPLLAWWRQSPDEKWRGVTHEGNKWATVLKDRRKNVLEQQVERISGQQRTDAAEVSDDTIDKALTRVRELYRRLRNVPASMPHKRAEMWHNQVEPDPDLARVREACDLWCALWFWPLDQLAEAPTPATLGAPSEAARAISRELRHSRRFFHWELEFPDVFNKKGAGFDAIVGNPPWEIRKPNSKEFFSDLDPLYRSYGKQEALTRQRELFAADPKRERKWLDYVGRFKDAGNFVRYAAEPFGDTEDEGGKPHIILVPRKVDESRKLHRKWAGQRARRTGYADPEHAFRHQGSADLNTYKLFVEQAHALLKPGGQLGLVTPSGLYTDKGSVSLRRLLLDRCQWRWLYGFENRNKLFDIHRSFKFAVTIAEKGGKTLTLQAAFMRHELEDWAEAKGALAYPAERVHAFSPKSLSVLEIRSERDLEVLTKIYANSVILGDNGPDGWGIQYGTEFHMTADSKLFIPRDKADEAGYKPDEYGRWIGPEDDVLLPLYQGSMIHQHDPSYKGWLTVEKASWGELSWSHKSWVPRYLLQQTDYRGNEKATHDLKLGFRDIARSTDERTSIAALVPDLPCGNVIGIFTTDNALPLSSVLNTFAFDFTARIRISGTHMNYYVVEELPLPPPALALSLSHVTTLLGMPLARFAPWWPRELWAQWSRRAITPHERLRLRCILDAVVAALYNLSRDDLRWVLRDCDHPKDRLSDKAFCRTLDPKGFWRVDRDQDPELRHTVLTLVAFDALGRLLAEHPGDRDAAIRAFSELNGGEGWMLPDTLCLAEHGLGHDARARVSQPVASRLGPRFLDWQLAQTPEESWAECERHARALLGDEEFERRFAEEPEPESSAPAQPVERPTEDSSAASGPRAEPGAARAKVDVHAKAATTAAESQLSFLVPAPDPSPAVSLAAPEPLAMTISQIRLLNFRNWGEEHWTTGIPLKTVTLILGRNSAGKTSILQPLRMLKQTIEATDAGTQLQLDSATDGLDLGSFLDVVHGHDSGRELGVGLDLPEHGISVDIRFRETNDRLVIASLVYRLGDDKVEVSYSSNNAYQLASPRFRLPNWDGASKVHEPKQDYRPGRAIELSERALDDLGPTLAPKLRAAMVAVKDAFKKFHYLGPMRPPPAREVAWLQQDPTRLGSMGQETIQALISNETGRDRGTLKTAVSAWLKRLDLADGIEVTQHGRSRRYEIQVLRGGNRSNLIDVGYGVSQVLPVIVLLHFAPEGSVVLCEDPEAHLHPMAQAELADMFVEVAKQRKLQVLLETHSEHLFRRLQFLIADGKVGRDDCALYFVDREEPSSKLTTLEADEYGRVHNWPDNFFGDAIGEVERQTHKVFEHMMVKRRARG
ncbi:AAA family ATPase [Nannocystis pusilla]|uniref:site-specific DNA-methyltransferase (adenine-specific) n=1 Tax=Nannocystis pusilla TaxID=889268 RepID=A0ABS7TIT0_9BACT|nr:DUF3696 domain-containing protein [Nannocystis pusilla]MBZ5708108.1 DUF3696 domain-containing protein [Nannocystis pusilla]